MSAPEVVSNGRNISPNMQFMTKLFWVFRAKEHPEQWMDQEDDEQPEVLTKNILFS